MEPKSMQFISMVLMGIALVGMLIHKECHGCGDMVPNMVLVDDHCPGCVRWIEDHLARSDVKLFLNSMYGNRWIEDHLTRSDVKLFLNSMYGKMAQQAAGEQV